MELIRNTCEFLGFTHVPFCPHNMVAMLGSLVSPFSALTNSLNMARLNWSVGSSLSKFRILAVFPVEALFPLYWDTDLELTEPKITGQKKTLHCLDFQIHISHSSGDWKSRIMVPARSGSDGSLSLSCRLWLLFVVSNTRTGMLFTLTRVWIPFHHVGSVSMTHPHLITSPNPYLPYTFTM